MKLSDRTRYLALGLALLATLLAVYFAPPAEEPADAVAEPAAPQTVKPQTPANLFAATDEKNAQGKPAIARSGMLPAPRKALEQEPGDLFQMDRPPPPPPPKPRKPLPPPPPVAPPLPYTYMGSMVDGNETSIFLLRDGQDRPYIAKAGDIIEGKYRLDSVRPPLAEFTYLPLAQKQTLNIGSAAQPSRGGGGAHAHGGASPAGLPSLTEIQQRLQQLQQNGANK